MANLLKAKTTAPGRQVSCQYNSIIYYRRTFIRLNSDLTDLNFDSFQVSFYETFSVKTPSLYEVH